MNQRIVRFIYLFAIFIVIAFPLKYALRLKTSFRALPISLKLIPSEGRKIVEVEVYRISSLRGTKHSLEFNNGLYLIHRSFTEKLVLKFNNEELKKMASIEVTIGDNQYLANSGQLEKYWSTDSSEANFTLLESNDSLKVDGSIWPILRNSMNWPGDYKVFLYGFYEIIAVIILLLVLIGGIILFSKETIYNYKNIWGIFLILVITVFTFYLSPSSGTGDVSYFLGWMEKSQQYGLIDGFREIKDNYPPLSYMIVALVQKVSTILNIDKFIIFKISLLLFLFATTGLFYYYTRNILMSLAMYLFLFMNPVGLGYIDIYIAPFFVGAMFFLLKKRYVLFSIFFSICCLIKYQPIMIAPFILFYVLNIESMSDYKKIDFKLVFVKIGAPAILILLSLILIFRMEFYFSFRRAVSHYTLAPNALNINWIIQYFMELYNKYSSNNISTLDLFFPRVLFYGTYFGLLYTYFKEKKSFENLLIYSTIGYFTYFMFNIGVHENHLFVLCLLCPVLYFINSKYKNLFIVLGIISNINLFVFYGVTGSLGFKRELFGDSIAIILALLNFVIYLFLLAQLFSRKLVKNSLKDVM